MAVKLTFEHGSRYTHVLDYKRSFIIKGLMRCDVEVKEYRKRGREYIDVVLKSNRKVLASWNDERILGWVLNDIED